MQGIFYPLFYRANIPTGYFLIHHGGKRVSLSFSLLDATLQTIKVTLSAAYIELTLFELSLALTTTSPPPSKEEVQVLFSRNTITSD